MKYNEKTKSLIEICCMSVFLLIEFLAMLILIMKEKIFIIAIVFALLFIPYSVFSLINAIKKYFMEIVVDESGIKRYYKKRLLQNLFWNDIYEIGLVEQRMKHQVCPPAIVISKASIDICDKKYLDMRGIYSKKVTIVMIYSYDIYTELKKHYKKDIMYYKKGDTPQKWDELILKERYPWILS